jgi:hypothetical protein
MNREILAGSVIVGIAVMLSMSMMPANAEKADNKCISNAAFGIICDIQLAVGQHIQIITEASTHSHNSAGCHYEVGDFQYEIPGTGEIIDFWTFGKVHGPENCDGQFLIQKSSVGVKDN